MAMRSPALVRQVSRKYDAEIMALETMSDQEHLLCQVDPQFGIHHLVNNIKAMSLHAFAQGVSRRAI
jgi:putative transposase